MKLIIACLLVFIVCLLIVIIRNQNRDKPRRLVLAAKLSVNDPLSEESWSIENEWHDRNKWAPIENVETIPAIGQYRINYIDAKGQSSDREIVVSGVCKYSGESLIEAHCLLRHAKRSFRQSRIQKAIDVQTGEIIDDVAEHAIDAYRHSPAGLADELFQREEAALGVLIYVARADGRMMKPERQVIINYLKAMHEDVLVDDSDIDEKIKACWFPPDEKDFKLRVLNLAESDPKRYTYVANAAKAIVATQKTIVPDEKMALEYLATYAPGPSH